VSKKNKDFIDYFLEFPLNLLAVLVIVILFFFLIEGFHFILRKLGFDFWWIQ